MYACVSSLLPDQYQHHQHQHQHDKLNTTHRVLDTDVDAPTNPLELLRYEQNMAAHLPTFSPTPASPPFPLAPLSFSTVYPSPFLLSFLSFLSFPLSFLLTVHHLPLPPLRPPTRHLAPRHPGELLKALGKGGKGGEEGRERARCVRQVYVGPASEPPYAIRHLDAGLISASASVTDTRTKAQTKAPNAKKYLARLLHVVEHCLPHLYVLEWNLPAPTLKEFVWKGHLLGPVLLPPPPSSFLHPANDDSDCDNSNDSDGKLPDFPHLRSVVLDRASPDCTLLLQHLVGENTRVSALALDSATSSTSSFLRSRGYVSSLTSFAWANTRAAEGSEGEESVLAFLKENAQIEKFEVTAGVDAGWAEGALLPLLRSFQSLTSLKMVFSAEDVPESSLSALAALSNLRTLCIAAGPAYPASPSWYPEHEVMGRVLAPMKELRRLVVMRDTYEVKAHALAPRREGGGGYYRVRTVPEGVEVEEWLTPAEVEVYRGTGPMLEFGVVREELVYHLVMCRRPPGLLPTANRLECVFPPSLGIRLDNRERKRPSNPPIKSINVSYYLVLNIFGAHRCNRGQVAVSHPLLSYIKPNILIIRPAYTSPLHSKISTCCKTAWRSQARQTPHFLSLSKNMTRRSPLSSASLCRPNLPR
ncbi:unnamed protein product [Cyclocybe aegerita]|uniref:Uncharacterized protein n=1 Tax=Cyclocybe aegerita TaxID=1973307 RepID=A0A8S0VV05_CYCAE|nr:unnamed protein product [Cyclocybe aegerita]